MNLEGQKEAELTRCHDCHCQEGELHGYGCDVESCPFCGNQLISCGCAYRLMALDVSEGSYAYKHGLTARQEEMWREMLEKRGRIPYVQIPNLCGLCGILWPEMFHVPDEEWKKYVVPALQSEMLCRKCYDGMRALFPNGWRAAKRKTPDVRSKKNACRGDVSRSR